MDLVKLVIILVLVVFFLGWKKPMAIVIFGATLLLTIFYAMPPLDFCLGYLRSISSWATIEILIIIWLVMLLEGLLGQKGSLKNMLASIDDLFHNKRINIISMPMIIGFLPSAGGALFSAPMVEKAAAETGLPPEGKTILNIYYRHVMEVFFPTYPAIIIAANVSGIPLFSLTTLLFPLAVLVMLIGFYFLRSLPREEKRPKSGDFGKRLLTALGSLWPFLLLLTLIMAVRLPVIWACAVTLLAVLILFKLPPRELPALIKSATKWKMLLIIITVMAFKDILMLSGAVDNLPEIISQLPLPPVLVFSLMSLFITLIIGMPYSAAVIVLPLAMAAMPDFTAATVAFLHFSAYIGAQLTPTHLCVSISAEYFNANLQKVLLGCAPAYLLLYVIAAVFYGFLLG